MVKLAITSTELLEQPSEVLANMKITSMRSRYQSNDLEGAVISACKSALKNKKSFYVYPGNAYNVAIYRVTYKLADALCPINNTGKLFYEVTEDCKVLKHLVTRPF